MGKFNGFREKYPLFVFDSYRVEETQTEFLIEYLFRIDGLAEFRPTWRFPKPKDCKVSATDGVFKKLVFFIGMVELISYWKVTCSPNVQVNAGFLSDAQIEWWKKQYYWGLGEFFYTNDIGIGIDGFMEIMTSQECINAACSEQKLHGCLIPIGGGKDSAVSLEILNGFKDTNMCYIINSRGATKQTAEVAGYTNQQVANVTRTLDKNMLELNKQGFLNGHTPFSAIVAFSSVLAAYIHGKKYVVLSNEDSANESTVQNTLINHQYSKSFEFEKDFCEYEAKYIKSGVNYFSLLRPLSELQIAEHFSKQKKYHAVFKSCNAGSKTNIWCGKCPKCLFVYLILSPFLSKKELVDIFDSVLTENAELTQIFEQLIGEQEEKPFECVGSRDEVNTAVCIAIAQMEKAGERLPFLLCHYKTLPVYREFYTRYNPYKNYYNAENLLPLEFDQIVKGQFLNK